MVSAAKVAQNERKTAPDGLFWRKRLRAELVGADEVTFFRGLYTGHPRWWNMNLETLSVLGFPSVGR